ncbi:ArsR/SmtB family transcription factor [Marinitenerispora sediminis]|uniref:Transcriptional regulator n=1 Tax=Marinitenerispora sediminis TaxID=1931232 RepID=A0A368SZJ5_9ACTN|nr:metalloregulator ArsR/SmtB family transcription factor [Marinitenerispora sediminis]RCV48680.1 transcriptional regulator [Marinitenerispora sediminis]RCV49195.1 transcriptional regulator [Marinitenerispora sediminis]RCV51232.1 transcriptional regulator [Marinitenerispora sediminis]
MGHKAANADGTASRGGNGSAEAAGPARLDAAGAAKVAETLQALAAPSRLLILTALRGGPRTVGEIVDAVRLSQSAVSHQLRLLRTLGLVTATRDGRSVSYALYDHHVAELLDQAVYHTEHLRLGLVDR